MDFLKEYINIATLVACLGVGFIIKKIDFIQDKYISLIVAILGVIFNVWANDWNINFSIFTTGVISGLASTGMYEAFDKWIKDLVIKVYQTIETKLCKQEEVNHEK